MKYALGVDVGGTNIRIAVVDENGKMCLPCFGTTDFKDLFKRLNDVGFDGALLLEVYKDDFKTYDELFESLYKVKNLAEKIMNK